MKFHLALIYIFISYSKISHVLNIYNSSFEPPSILFCVWRSDPHKKVILGSHYHFKEAIIKLVNIIFLRTEESQDKDFLLQKHYSLWYVPLC